MCPCMCDDPPFSLCVLLMNLGFDAPTVWSEFTPLANANKAVNLGQGFPDWATPDFAKKAFIEVISTVLFVVSDVHVVYMYE